MKKFVVTLLLAVFTLGASAQFEKGTHYGEASVAGLGIGYGQGQFNFGIGAGYGYYVADCWMIGGRLGYLHQGSQYNNAVVQALFRYSFKKNGLNVGGGLQYQHGRGDLVQLCPQVGYTFYLNHYISLEPSVYCDLCMNDFKDGTNVGLRIGIGLYYNKKKK